ncbi:MAG TPA: hypothetical protein VGF32_04065 [Streptosporangiaceae bacterium]
MGRRAADARGNARFSLGVQGNGRAYQQRCVSPVTGEPGEARWTTARSGSVLSSSQFSPRVPRHLMQERVIQSLHWVFVAT